MLRFPDRNKKSENWKKTLSSVSAACRSLPEKLQKEVCVNSFTENDAGHNA